MEYVNVARREFAGRAFSVMKQIRKELEFLEQARKILSEFPSIKSDMKKIAIAGFPNVGKSTLLAKISKLNSITSKISGSGLKTTVVPVL